MPSYYIHRFGLTGLTSGRTSYTRSGSPMSKKYLLLWFTECVSMSHKYLREQFDIHGGGQDLIWIPTSQSKISKYID